MLTLTRRIALPMLLGMCHAVAMAHHDEFEHNHNNVPFTNQITCDSAKTNQSSARIIYDLTAITEGQWNLTSGRGGWANKLDAGIGVKLWTGATAEGRVLSTWQPTDAVADVCQDFSNINAPNRPLRLIHFGLQQTLGKMSVYAGLREADEDYFCTPLAGISTGASCGCAPTVNDNFHINVFPLTSLGLHVTYQPIEPLTIQASLYNGIAYDTFHRSFRFRPHRDGVITLGSISYERPADNDEDFGATYLIGWNFGNHYRESTQRRHSQSGFWLTAEQPICHLGRVGVAVGATFAHEFKDPEVATGYWNGTLALNRLTRIGGTFALVFNRAYYHEAHESDLEATFSLPLGKYFTLQPALHHYSTNGQSQWLAQMRVTFAL